MLIDISITLTSRERTTVRLERSFDHHDEAALEEVQAALQNAARQLQRQPEDMRQQRPRPINGKGEVAT